MRPATKLGDLRSSAVKNLSRIEGRVAAVSLSRVDPSVDLVISSACIGLLSTWSNFVRAYYLSCFIHPRREGGGHVGVDSAFDGLSFQDAIGHAVATLRGNPPGGPWRRRDEPTWHDPYTLRTLTASIGCSNTQDVIDGLGIESRVFTDLPTFRNFYAHRNWGTFDAAVGLRMHHQIATRKSPTAVLLSCAYQRPQALLLDWVSDIQDVVEYLCI